MDIAFSLDEAARATFFQAIMQSFHSTYICLWSYVPHPSNCLWNLDGLYREDEDEKQQPSSSSGSFQRRLFDDYRQLIFNVEDNFVPGHAFKNNMSFLDVQKSVFQTHTLSQIQRQFYAAAGIKVWSVIESLFVRKSAVFMGSSNGEIELGFLEVNMVEKMKQITSPLSPGWNEVSSVGVAVLQNPLPAATSSSSSLKSPTVEESPETEMSPSFFYNDLSQILLLPPPPPLPPSGGSRGKSAFEKYVKKKAVALAEDHDGRTRESMMKKWIVLYRNLRLMGIRERTQAATRSASAQFLHMIAERRRREKLNERLLALRSILPPGTKKDKASVLATTREYLIKLKAQVSELSQRNQMLLEAQSLQNTKLDEATATSALNERFTVSLSHAPAPPESSGEIIDLEITVRGEGWLMAEITIRVLDFLNNIANVRVVLSFHAHQQVPPSLCRLAFRFSLQGGEWDESAFLEAMRRIVSNLAPF